MVMLQEYLNTLHRVEALGRRVQMRPCSSKHSTDCLVVQVAERVRQMAELLLVAVALSASVETAVALPTEVAGAVLAEI